MQGDTFAGAGKAGDDNQFHGQEVYIAFDPESESLSAILCTKGKEKARIFCSYR
jgi:hypothetical protein